MFKKIFNRLFNKEKEYSQVGEEIQRQIANGSLSNKDIASYFKVLECYGTKGELVKTFTIKDGEDYIKKGKEFAVSNNCSIGIK
jgi:hypothetical protein